jgi:hypothetical protein
MQKCESIHSLASARFLAICQRIPGTPDLSLPATS